MGNFFIDGYCFISLLSHDTLLIHFYYFKGRLNGFFVNLIGLTIGINIAQKVSQMFRVKTKDDTDVSEMFLAVDSASEIWLFSLSL